jgi:hypothetical protein
MPTPKQEFESIDPSSLEKVAGGASRGSKGDSEVSSALSAIQDSLKDLAGSKNQGMDPMQMILIMMMMGGFGGGGGGGGYALGAGHSPPVINVATGVAGGGGCRRGGKKGW